MNTLVSNHTTSMIEVSSLRRRFLVMHFCKLKNSLDLLR